MSDWAGLGQQDKWGLQDRWATLHPGWRTAAVFAVATLISLMIPNSLVEGLVGALGLPPPATPPVGFFGRVALALGTGWFAATLFATANLVRAGQPVAAVGRPDQLKVEPLAAERELGARFDDSPYLAPPPPTSDARLDPDSTLADPRWEEGRTPIADWDDEWDRQPAEFASGEDRPTADEAGDELTKATFEWEGNWDRAVPDRQAPDAVPDQHEADTVFAEHPTDPADPAAQPGKAAEQWDGPADEIAPVEQAVAAEVDPVDPPVETAPDWTIRAPDEQAVDEPVDELPAGELVGQEQVAAEPVVATAGQPFPATEAFDATDNVGSSTAELIDRVNALAARGARLPARARATDGDAAERIADALKALRATG